VIYLRLLFLFLFFLSFAGRAQTNPAPIAEFLFNGEQVYKGPVRPKIYGARSTEDRFGNKDNALYLLGNPDSYINLGSDTILKNREATISLWLNIDQVIYKGSGIEVNPVLTTLSHAGDDFNEAFTIAYHFSVRKLHANTSFSEHQQSYVYPAQTSYLRRWYHAVITYDDKFLCFYLDGVLEGKVAKNFKSKFLNGDSILIGKREGLKNKRYFQGTIDDIQFFNRVLTPAQVQVLYNAPNPNKNAIIKKWIFGSFLFIFVLLILLYIVRERIRYAVRKERNKLLMRNRSYEQEIRILKAQMNPHFIFNALNSIQQFIITGDNEKSQLYLSKFSTLIRKLLDSTTKDSLLLKDEIELIERYIEIESLRFGGVFEFETKLSESLTDREIYIPHFLIQPFVENAIWHGLLPKKGEKKLIIAFALSNEHELTAIIDDNGVGRQTPGKKGHLSKSSLAIDFISQRLQLLGKMYNRTYALKIVDKLTETGVPLGTTVILTIPILNQPHHVKDNNN